MSDRRFFILLAIAIYAVMSGAIILDRWLQAPYRTCVELRSVDTCHRIFHP